MEGRVICLDTNFLIGGLTETRPESRHLVAWHRAGTTFCTPASAWYEFLCGPVDSSQIKTMQAFLKGGILAFEEPQARIAARLFSATGRIRRLRVDAIIAATAVTMKVPLATLNHEDFRRFVPYGLELATPPDTGP